MDRPQALRHSELEVVPPREATAPKYEQYSSPEYRPDQATREARTIFGLRPTTFFLILALVLVILAAGIGGGVGGTIAVKNAKNAGTTTYTTTYTTSIYVATASPTTSSVLNLPTTGLIPLNCPSIDNTNIRVTLGTQTSLFGVTCGADFASVTGRQIDILAITSYSLQDCAEACASYNRNMGLNVCKGATFNSDLTASLLPHFGNCFLKNDTAGELQSTTNSYAGLLLK